MSNLKSARSKTDSFSKRAVAKGKAPRATPPRATPPRAASGAGALTAGDVMYVNGLPPAAHSYGEPLADEGIDELASDEIAVPTAKYASLLTAHDIDVPAAVSTARALLPNIAAYRRLQAATDRARGVIVNDVASLREVETELARVVRALPKTHPLRVALAAFLAHYADRHGVAKRAATLRHKKKTPPAGGVPGASAA